MQPIPKHLEVDDLKIICWAEISPKVRYEESYRFFDGSRGQPDPRFHYLIIAPDQIQGFEPHYLSVYFDEHGRWITQSAFETLRETIDHARNTFEIRDWQWNWLEPETLQNIEGDF